MQTTDHLLMVRPCRFGFNEETAANNAFQKRSATTDEALRIQRQAVEEFDHYVDLLRGHGVRVEVLQDTPEPFTPDSIFPNNCFSTHCLGSERVLVLYPMFAPNRRRERDKLRTLLDTLSFDRVIDLTSWEAQGQYLEGTGSLILDRDHFIAYACRSPRTHRTVLEAWAEAMGYRCFLFDSADENAQPVYHTNVVMHIGTRFAVVCMESVSDPAQREQLAELLKQSGKEIISISFEQLHRFAGNMLEVRNGSGEKLLLMSATARASLTRDQLHTLEEDVRILAPDLHAIETAGGGSARCMTAELFQSYPPLY